MAGYVTKTGKDALGNEFSLQFWQNDDGSLQPVQRPVLGDGERMPVDIQGSDLSTLATDANLTTLIDKVSGDQATQTTLAAVLSELQSKADEATLASILQELEKKADPSEAQTTVLSGSIAENLTPAMEETVAAHRGGTLAAGTSETVLDVTQGCDLESLALGSDDPEATLRVDPYSAAGSASPGMRFVSPSGSNTVPVAPYYLNQLGGENDFWREFLYDEEADTFSMGMKRQTRFGNGVRIQIENPKAYSINAAVTTMACKFKKLESA